MDTLLAGVEEIRRSPRDGGELVLIARRPRTSVREVLEIAELDPADGLVGDNWVARGSRNAPDGAADPGMQLTLMNARAAALVARRRDRWQLAGDQLYVDLDLSGGNLPPGTRLGIGSAEIEITPVPHTGCRKFVDRFGLDAMKFVNSSIGRELNLRGVYARVVRGGRIAVGDAVLKLQARLSPASR